MVVKRNTEKSREAAQAIIKGAREPKIEQGIYTRTLVEFMNYHNAHSDSKMKRKWLYTGLLKEGKTDFVEILHDAKDHELDQIGVLSRARDSGQYLSSKHLALINTTVAKLVLKYANAALAADEAEESAEPAAPKADRNELLATAFYGEIVQGMVDDYVTNVRSVLKYEPPSLKTKLETNNVNPAQAEIVADKLAPLVLELSEAVAGKDAQLKEAWSGWTKTQLKAFAIWASTLLEDCMSRSVIVKATKKPRVVKNKPLKSPVAKLKYQANLPELGLKSVDPLAILSAEELFCYRTENRKMVYFKAKAGMKLSVAGQTVLNLDEELSGSKTIRKPELFFKGLNFAKKTLMQAYENVQTSEGDAPSRIMGDMILLKAF